MSARQWDKEIVDRLRALWGSTSATEIAAILTREFRPQSFSRNAVIGKADRIGLRRLNKVPRKTGSKPPARRPHMLLETPQSAAAPREVRIPHHVSTADPHRPGKPLELVQQSHGCRWPVNDAKPHLFCGDHIHAGMYCAEHHVRAVRMFAEAAE